MLNFNQREAQNLNLIILSVRSVYTTLYATITDLRLGMYIDYPAYVTALFRYIFDEKPTSCMSADLAYSDCRQLVQHLNLSLPEMMLVEHRGLLMALEESGDAIEMIHMLRTNDRISGFFWEIDNQWNMRITMQPSNKDYTFSEQDIKDCYAPPYPNPLK